MSSGGSFVVIHSHPPSSGDQCINPPFLLHGGDYDRMCKTVSRATALQRYKAQNASQFSADSAEGRTQAAWQKAFEYWNGGLDLAAEKEAQSKFPDEIQAIRNHLWGIICEEHRKKVVSFFDRWEVRTIFWMNDVLRSNVARKCIKVAGVFLVGYFVKTMFYGTTSAVASNAGTEADQEHR